MNRPLQLTMGYLCMQAEAAQRHGQLTLSVLIGNARRHADTVGDLFTECADAATNIEQRNRTLVGKIELYASDGIFDRYERDELIRLEEEDICDAIHIRELAMGGAA